MEGGSLSKLIVFLVIVIVVAVAQDSFLAAEEQSRQGNLGIHRSCHKRHSVSGIGTLELSTKIYSYSLELASSYLCARR